MSSFITYMPCDALKPYVKSFAISMNEKASSYKVLPGTGMVMGFQFSGKLSYTQNDQVNKLSNAGITGLLDTYRVFNNVANTGSVLVMFTETGAAAFFAEPMHELYNSSLALDDLMLRSQMDVVVEKLHASRNDAERIAVIEEFLVSRLNRDVADPMVLLAVQLIRQSRGSVKMASLAEKLNISQGRFEKRFRKLVGCSPKKFASLVRINHVISLDAATDLINIGFDAGYFDQAHFIKDFKSYTGQTPEQFFGKSKNDDFLQ